MPDFTKIKDLDIIDDARAIQDIARETGGWHQLQKESSTELGKSRLEFFDACSKQVSTKTLAQKTFLIKEKGLTLVDAEKRTLKYNPGWVKVISNGDKDKGWKFRLREDPDLIGHTVITDPIDDEPGYVVTRTIRSGSTMIDLDRMEKDDYDLFMGVTFMAEDEMLRDILDLSGVPREEWGVALENTYHRFGLHRQPKPADQLTPAQVEAIKPYMYEGPKSVALNVRLAKPEDYDES